MSNFEADYWHKEDPDGRLRDYTKERLLRLDTAKDEIAYINNLPQGKLLDWGCGLGFCLSGIDEKHEKWGFDISLYAIQKAKELNPTTVFKDEIFYEGYAGYFDIILCYHVLEHLTEEEAMITIYKFGLLLKDRGKLIIGTPNGSCYISEKWEEKFRMRHDSTHKTLWTSERLRYILEKNNIFINKIEYPFSGTRFDTEEHVRRALGPVDKEWSPPFYGNLMTIYTEKRVE